ncbi:hypothetical protein NQ317_019602 [Molorchus minor]|uniref:Uncharacterized protein n=1 Tax=Molorchus minor TaxID=1323400 RepID=A0ABQ9JAX8_9CUCU|nr:hypothetical protein NQ317_019602 [Molorchus minor]
MAHVYARPHHMLQTEEEVLGIVEDDPSTSTREIVPTPTRAISVSKQIITPETDEWTLQIKWAQKRDAGIYECQISTQPVRSYFVNLNVVGKIIGPKIFYVYKYRVEANTAS